MTNPLPEWYIERLRRDGRLASLQPARPPTYRVGNLRGVPIPAPEAVRRRIDEETWALAARGPLTLRIRLWWMRLWLPKDDA